MAETYPHVRVNECMPDTPSRCRCGAGLNNAYYFFDAKTWGENCPAAFHDALARVETKRDRLQAILDAETGKRGPEGWAWDGSGWTRDNAIGEVLFVTGRGHDRRSFRRWEWYWQNVSGRAETALEALEAADLAAKEAK